MPFQKLPLNAFLWGMNHEFYMQRCFDLARLGAGSVSPNPMVGAVLVYEGRIIGEGWHQNYGGPHAEVNALANVLESDRTLISQSTLYVSLEPCCIFGKTPPCTNLILENKIPRVVIAALDLTPAVSGQGVGILQQAGVEVISGILQKEGEELASIRNTFASQKRPYVLLKFAQTKNGFMGQKGKQVWISGPFSNRLSHRLRAAHGAILVGTQTALVDSPQLTTRQWFGKSPLRVLIDRNLRVPATNNIFSAAAQTLVVSELTAPSPAAANVEYLQLPFDDSLLQNLLAFLFERKISSLIVEGGAYTLQQFIEKNLWDEAWTFTADKFLSTGITAPKIPSQPNSSHQIDEDILTIFRNPPSFR